MVQHWSYTAKQWTGRLGSQRTSPVLPQLDSHCYGHPESSPNLTLIIFHLTWTNEGRVDKRQHNLQPFSHEISTGFHRAPRPQSGVDLEQNLQPRKRFESSWKTDRHTALEWLEHLELMSLISLMSSVFIPCLPVAWRHHTSCFVAAPLTLCSSQCNTHGALFRDQTRKNPKNTIPECIEERKPLKPHGCDVNRVKERSQDKLIPKTRLPPIEAIGGKKILLPRCKSSKIHF